MRDLALILAMAGGLPLAFRFAYVGMYLWVWLTLMNPHRLVYTYAQNQPFNFAVAVVTIIAWVTSRERKVIPVNGFVILTVLFSIWISLTTLFAPSPEFTTPLWSRNIKTMFLMYVIIGLATTRARIHGLVWIIAISLAYYGVKGGGFMIMTGGNYKVFGPSETQIEDNNQLALALVMTIPILIYLRQYTTHTLLRLGLLGATLLALASVLGSYSRGGLIALGAMFSFLWTKSKSKVAILAVAGGTLIAVFFVMPQQYMDRISTIADASEDASVQGRLEAWEVAYRTAMDRPLGAGFDGPRQPIIWDRYLPEIQARASHSIYFMVLGEHGLIGLGLYLSMCAAAWLNFNRIITLTRDKPDLAWACDLASALKISALGFLVGGAALPMAYYDGFLSLLALGAAVLRVVEVELGPKPAPKPNVYDEYDLDFPPQQVSPRASEG